MAIPITKRQKEVLYFIKGFIRDKGYSPTLEEIRKKLRLSAVSTVHQHIDALIDKGYIKKFNNLARAIEINDFNEKRQNNFIEIPLLGMITAGEPIEAIEIPETVSIPKELNAGQGRHYALRVRVVNNVRTIIQDQKRHVCLPNLENYTKFTLIKKECD
jgi:repressor LexA